MKAIGNNIIILPKKEIIEKTKGGLLLAEKDKENIRYKEATIISTSDEITVVGTGDEIYYDKAAGHDIEFNGEQYRIIQLRDIVIVK